MAAAAVSAPSAFLAGSSLATRTQRSRTTVNTTIQANGKKVDIKKQGLNSIENKTIQLNLMGKSESMEKKGWKDASGSPGKGYGVFRYANKYGANVDGYSPIFTPDVWSESGDTYKMGAKGLIAWAGLIVVLLGVGVTLVVTTSSIGQ